MRFSILMANYNNSKYIGEAIKSVMAQTFNDWELIIVDDKSSDDSLEVIKHVLYDQRINIFKHEQNLGCGAAKRRCAAEARGEILVVLDPDDVLAADALEKVNAIYLNNPGLGFVYSTHYECDEKLKVLKVNSWIGEYNKEKTNLLDIKTGALRTFKKSAYCKTLGFDPAFKKAVDKDLIYKMEEATNFKFLNEPLYYYRMTKSGIAAKGKMSQEARLWETRAKYNAYKRRLSMEVSNLSKKEMRAQILNSISRSLRYGFFDQVPYLLKIFIYA